MHLCRIWARALDRCIGYGVSKKWARYYRRMSMTVTWTLGEVLAKLRKDQGLDQATMAARVGIARNTLSNYETNKSGPPFEVVVRWAAVCGVSLDAIAGMCAPWDLNPEPTDSESDAAAFWGIVAQLDATPAPLTLAL